jgi:formylglycine-generating enzyme required for sulfatase activity
MLTLRACLLSAILIGSAPQDERTRILGLFRKDFVALRPGEKGFPNRFDMGSRSGGSAEEPVHPVTLGYAFQISRTETPQNVWEAVTGQNPSRWKGPRNSAEMLSFDDAVRFCARATEQMRAAKLIEPAEIVRLPSEAEWEYAARAGTSTRYSFGDDASDLGAYAWYRQNAAGNDPPGGAKKPNGFGLYDVHGYLWEWCQDAWHDTYREAPADGSAWAAGGDPKRRVLRGGSWKDPAERLTSSCRRAEAPDFKDDSVGLRCVIAREKSP